MKKIFCIGMPVFVLLVGIIIATGRKLDRSPHEIAGAGPQVTKSNRTEPLSSIRLEAPVSVEVVDGPEWKYTITDCGNRLDLIRIDVSDGELRIATTEPGTRFRKDEPARITVTAPRPLNAVDVFRVGILRMSRPTVTAAFSLNASRQGRVHISQLGTAKLKVRISGKGRAAIGDMRSDDLAVETDGNARFSAEGRTVRLKARVSGRSKLDPSDMKVSEAKCVVSGMSLARVDDLPQCERPELSRLVYSSHLGDRREERSDISTVNADLPPAVRIG